MEPVTIGAPRASLFFVLASEPDRTWEIPLASSLSVADFYEFAEAYDGATRPGDRNRAQLALFEKFAPGISEHLSMGDLGELMGEWLKASGMGLGESSAS